MQISKLSFILAMFAFCNITSFYAKAGIVSNNLANGTSTIETIGDYGQFAPTLTALAIAGFKKDKEGFKQLALTTASTVVATQIGKKAFNHVYIGGESMGRRPNGGMNNFPSGHTSMSFSGAWFIKKRYGWKYGVAPVAIAAFTGYSRIQSKNHDLKAVVAGALTGILFAELFTKKLDDNKNLQVSFNSNGYNSLNFNASYTF